MRSEILAIGAAHHPMTLSRLTDPGLMTATLLHTTISDNMLGQSRAQATTHAPPPQFLGRSVSGIHFATYVNVATMTVFPLPPLEFIVQTSLVFSRIRRQCAHHNHPRPAAAANALPKQHAIDIPISALD